MKDLIELIDHSDTSQVLFVWVVVVCPIFILAQLNHFTDSIRKIADAYEKGRKE